MNATLARPAGSSWLRVGAFLVVAAALLSIEHWALTQLSTVDAPQLLAWAVAADLLLVLPAIAWLLLVRRGPARPFVLIPIFLGATWLANLWIPDEHAAPLRLATAVAPVLEIALVGWIGWRVVSTFRRRRASVAGAGAVDDPLESWERDLADTLGSPRLASIVATELGALVYAIAGWRLSPPAPPAGATAHAVHRHGGYPTLLAVLGGLMLVETVGVHLLLSLWDVRVAWVVTALGAYGAVWLAGDYQAMRLRPLIVTADEIVARCGLRWRVHVRREQIAAVHRELPDAAEGQRQVALVPLNGPDVWLELTHPIEVIGPFGLRRRARWIGLGAGDADALRAAIAGER